MSAGSSSPHVFDADLASFDTAVLARSEELPVVVDFWAGWCGPCRTLGPALEAAVDARGGDVVLAKVDVDANQALAQRFRVQGIPAVKAFVDGQVVAEFTGAVGPAQIEAFLDQVVPSEVDRLVADARARSDSDPAAARASLERALEHAPGHVGAALALAELVLDEDPDRARALATPHRPDPRAETVLTRVELGAAGGDVDTLRTQVAAAPDDTALRLTFGRALAAAGHYAEAAEQLLAVVERGEAEREPAREQLVALFNLLGSEHDVVRRTRPRLARALF